MKPKQAYAELVRLSREETLLASCSDMLEWDQEVFMPRKGAQYRSEQMAFLAGLAHDRATDPRYDELLRIVEASSLTSDPESPAAVNVRELRRGYDREVRLPRFTTGGRASAARFSGDHLRSADPPRFPEPQSGDRNRG